MTSNFEADLERVEWFTKLGNWQSSEISPIDNNLPMVYPST